MDSALTTRPPTLAPASLPSRADQHPVAVYLARLSPGSRPAMRQALGAVAEVLSSGRATLETPPGASLRYQHTAAVRAHPQRPRTEDRRARGPLRLRPGIG